MGGRAKLVGSRVGPGASIGLRRLLGAYVM